MLNILSLLLAVGQSCTSCLNPPLLKWKSLMSETIGFKPTSVSLNGITALIRNMGRDCTPDQFLREFVQNALEACQRAGLEGGRVLIDYNNIIQAHSGFYKLSFTDNGDGMSLQQMNNLLNSISSSGGVGNSFENYGVGAKISSLTRNHFGVQYESWQGGVGHSIIVRYNPKYDVYGIQGFPDGRGGVVYHRSIAPAMKPEMIQDHGTRVTLFGNTLEHDTMAPPSGMGGDKGTWLFQYLNRRYFSLPENISIDVRHGYDQDANNTALNYLRKLEGFNDSLLAESYEYGSLALRDARAYWYLLNEASLIKGHSALLNQDEIFNIEGEWSNRLTHFGILLGRDRMVIIIEPHAASQNIARTHLKKPDGSEFWWRPWQDEFRANLPQAIQAYLNSLLNQRNKASASKAIQKKLMSLKSLYDLCGFKPLEVLAPAELDVPIAVEEVERSKERSPEGLNADLLSEPETKIVAEPEPQEVLENYFPRVEWTDEKQSSQLAGRAAEYIEYSNIILANQDFKGFQDLLKYFSGKYELSDARINALRCAILDNAEQALMEAVAGVLSLKSDASWAGNYHQALTKEALSAVVMQRFWSVKAIEDELIAIASAGT